MTLKTVGEMAPALVAAAYTGGGTLVAGSIMGVTNSLNLIIKQIKKQENLE